jgi:mono/diheme cytochrome c family protein
MKVADNPCGLRKNPGRSRCGKQRFDSRNGSSRFDVLRTMQRFRSTWVTIFSVLVFALGALSTAWAGEAPHPLVWDAMKKSASPNFEDGSARFEFHVTNTSRRPVIVRQIRASCGCTTWEAPRLPWTLAPGERGTVKVAVDFRGKEGEIARDLLVGTVEGTQMLMMVIQVPQMDAAMRERNQAMAAANRQLVFQGDCAACHAAPAESRFGIDLFEAVCAICHQAKHRAAMVPDLSVAKEKRDAAWWTRWVEDGREGTLMPGFAKKHGGPLSEPQIESLVEYLLTAFPTEPKKE